LYLVRVGQVGVYRLMDGKETLISVIEGINFFGEMEVIVHGNRLATIKAISMNVIVYAFKNPDMSAIIANPALGEKLVTRLSLDLKIFSEKAIKFEIESKHNQLKLETLTQQITLLLSLVIDLQNRIGSHAVLETRDREYLSSICEMIQNFARARLPEIQRPLKAISPGVIKELMEEGILPETLHDLL
jgi:CRP-like cAMP-binding protein